MSQVNVEQTVLSDDQRIASRLRSEFKTTGTLCLNFIGSPGAGKTMFLERTLANLPALTRVAILTGDIQSDNDAIRLARYGYPVRQITTSGACDLKAEMLESNLWGWDFTELDLLFIENVGNLICPARHDLGEDAKIMVLSVSEGEDMPLKYPIIFRQAELVILNKVDLLPHISFKPELVCEYARRVHPKIGVIQTCCKTDAGIEEWLTWLALRVDRKQAAVAPHTPTIH